MIRIQLFQASFDSIKVFKGHERIEEEEGVITKTLNRQLENLLQKYMKVELPLSYEDDGPIWI